MLPPETLAKIVQNQVRYLNVWLYFVYHKNNCVQVLNLEFFPLMNASALSIEKQFNFMKLYVSSLRSHYLYDESVRFQFALKQCTEILFWLVVFSLLL